MSEISRLNFINVNAYEFAQQARLDESLESRVRVRVSKTFSKPVSILLLFLRLFLYTRSVGNSSTSTRWIWEELHDCIFYPFISLFLMVYLTLAQNV